MNLFDELVKDAQADLDSGKFLQSNEVLNEVNEKIADMEKKMDETLKAATDKIMSAASAGNKNVPESNNDETNDDQKMEGENNDGNN